jgi:GTP-binding protein HflX
MKAVIVMLKEGEFEERKAEIKRLANTGGYEVIKTFTQNAGPRGKYLIGRGKVDEIKNFINENNIELVIFENYLTSRQVLSLEEEFGVPVMDKFDLILNIFEKHAASKEAKLQIELARLKRKLPYIKMSVGRRVREDHPGFGSSGEYIVHSTLRSLHRRIKKIEDELEKFDARLESQGKRRKKKGKTVSLVGYTNVGKTTLLNRLTGVDKKAEDELFTTLKSKTASLNSKIFITDTIGFIRNIPHELIYAFRATLKEIKTADLILLVLDASDSESEFRRKLKVCEDTLIKIGADSIPVIHVLNKIDISDGEKEGLLNDYVKISAKYGVGLDRLKERIIEELA